MLVHLTKQHRRKHTGVTGTQVVCQGNETTKHHLTVKHETSKVWCQIHVLVLQNNLIHVAKFYMWQTSLHYSMPSCRFSWYLPTHLKFGNFSCQFSVHSHLVAYKLCKNYSERRERERERKREREYYTRVPFTCELTIFIPGTQYI